MNKYLSVAVFPSLPWLRVGGMNFIHSPTNLDFPPTSLINKRRITQDIIYLFTISLTHLPVFWAGFAWIYTLAVRVLRLYPLKGPLKALAIFQLMATLFRWKTKLYCERLSGTSLDLTAFN